MVKLQNCRQNRKKSEYRKRAYEQFMDEVLSKEEYLELKQMYENRESEISKKNYQN